MTGDMTWTFELVPQTNLAVATHHDSIDACLARHRHDRIYGVVAREQPTDADQYTR